MTMKYQLDLVEKVLNNNNKKNVEGIGLLGGQKSKADYELSNKTSNPEWLGPHSLTIEILKLMILMGPTDLRGTKTPVTKQALT